jgi:hypothetical protein
MLLSKDFSLVINEENPSSFQVGILFAGSAPV